MIKIAFTCGDINGIGPELAIKTFNRINPHSRNKIIYLCPANVFKTTLSKIEPAFDYQVSTSYDNNCDPDFIDVIDLGDSEQNIGQPTETSGTVCFNAIKDSFDLAYKKKVDAIVTAPISKYALSLAGIEFPGHTEMYAKWCNTSSFVMMFVSTVFKAALLTIHEPIKRVPELITEENINKTLNALIESLNIDFRIEQPRIAVLGLNPHAGENGRIGDEESAIIEPAIRSSLNKQNLYGPFVPDAFFANKMYEKYDLVLGMYHDQVLIPFKMLCFSSGVNYTSGLPIIRTSPDHGTAFDIAGKFIANEGSMLEAFYLAENISLNRKRYGLS